MGKSQETYSKKENEKKRRARKKEKAEKAEERKANSSKGKGLDEMMAYIDENGNISDTPPDPKKKKVFNVEDVQMGAAKIEADDRMDTIRTGVVTFFNEAKGYGFIKDMQSQESIFVHVHALVDPIKEGNKVTFGIEKGPKGLNATDVKLTV